MGFLDKLKTEGEKMKKAATDAVNQHSGTISTGVDKVADTVDKKTKGKYHDKVEQAKGAAKSGMDRLDGTRDDFTEDEPRRRDDGDVDPEGRS